MTRVSSRLSRIKPSVTLAVTAKAQELRAGGVDVISFSAGEPDFPTPEHIVEAAVKALHEGATRYTPVPGTPALRKAVAAQSVDVRGVDCDPAEVIVTVGAKHALYGFFQAILEPGDEVIIPAPYWVSYPDQVLLAGGEPVIVETVAADGWILTPDKLQAAAGPRTRVVVINSPSNPTGGVYPPGAMEAITEKARELGLWIVSDEIYRDLIYGDGRHVSPLSVGTDRSKIFVVDGVSKTYAMTGWRIGWGIGDRDVIAAMSKIQGQSTSNPTTVAQAAALAAITSPADFLPGWKAQYVARRDAMVEGLREMESVNCMIPDGAFYVLPEVTALVRRLGSEATDVDLATYLLEEAHVATVPGSGFGVPGHIRLSYATSMEAIRIGLERMAAAFLKLS